MKQIILNALQEVVSHTTYNKNKKQFVVNVYRTTRLLGYDTAILNDLYLIVDGYDFQFIKHSKDYSYTVKSL